MNTNKIKKALQACQGLLAENYAEYDGPPEKHPLNFIDDALAELDKAQRPVVTHMSIAPNASQETKAAVAEVVKAAYAYRPGMVLTDQKCKEIEQAWQQAHGADITHTMAFSDGLATARDYLSPAAGLKEQQPPSTSDPVDAYAIAKHGAGWIVAYYGKAKSPSDPDSPQDGKECWRYCNTEDEVNSSVLCWRPMAPAAGLTVEEFEQFVQEWCLEWCERVAPENSDWSDLCARLTAAINAKAAKP